MQLSRVVNEYIITSDCPMQYHQCGVKFAAVTVGCVGVYTIFTLAITQWR